MRNCNRKINLAILALIAAGLLGGPMEIQAQEPPEERENYALITHTNGMTWKEKIIGVPTSEGLPAYHLGFLQRHKPQIAEIVVPENALINVIRAEGCVNLTNIVIHPKTAPPYASWFRSGPLEIDVGENSELRNITCYGEMRDRIIIYGHAKFHAGGWSIIPPVQWTELFPWVEPEPPRIEIKTHAAANGKEMEIVWRDGTLQTADAVNGEYRDHLGQSPLRFPLAAAKDKQFFRIARIESPTTEEPPTPQTSGGGR